MSLTVSKISVCRPLFFTRTKPLRKKITIAIIFDTFQTVMSVFKNEFIYRSAANDQHCNFQWHSFQSKTSLEASSASWGIYQPLPTSILYVFENLELELSLTTISVETDQPVLDDYTCLIRLQKGRSASLK